MKFSKIYSRTRGLLLIQFEPLLMIIGGYFLYQDQLRT